VKLRVLARRSGSSACWGGHGLDEFVAETHLYRPLRFVFLASPWIWFERRKSASRGERLRLALEELGPIFIKLGQALSTRRDLLPHDIAEELARLQDRVPPFDGALARDIVERAYGKPITDTFREFRREAAGCRLDCPGAGRHAARGPRSSSRCCAPACARSSIAISR
jgi:ubiquinone biosynthesis protein